MLKITRTAPSYNLLEVTEVASNALRGKFPADNNTSGPFTVIQDGEHGQVFCVPPHGKLEIEAV